MADHTRTPSHNIWSMHMTSSRYSVLLSRHRPGNRSRDMPRETDEPGGQSDCIMSGSGCLLSRVNQAGCSDDAKGLRTSVSSWTCPFLAVSDAGSSMVGAVAFASLRGAPPPLRQPNAAPMISNIQVSNQKGGTRYSGAFRMSRRLSGCAPVT